MMAGPCGGAGGFIAGFAEGLLSGGIRLATCHPGFHSHAIAAALGIQVWSPCEKSAFCAAWGASLAGTRSAFLTKSVGLNDAADALANAAALGCHAGMVIVVTDDIDIEQTQIRQDSRHYHRLAPLPWLEPLSQAHAVRCAAMAPRLSEWLGCPVVIRLTNAHFHAVGAGEDPTVPVLPSDAPSGPFRRMPRERVAHPSLVGGQVARMAQRERKFLAWAEGTFTPPTMDEPNGHLRFGCLHNGEMCPQEAAKGFTLPLPLGLVRWASLRQQVRVTEMGDPIVAGELSRHLASDAVLTMPAPAPEYTIAHRSTERFRPVYRALRDRYRPVVVGDLGSHLMDEERSVDACLCYGGSIATAAGLAAADPDLSVSAVLGDGAFGHSGMQGLGEAVARGVRLAVVVLDNGGCQSTGGQTTAATLSEAALGIPVVTLAEGEASTCLPGLLAGWDRGVLLVRVDCREKGT